MNLNFCLSRAILFRWLSGQMIWANLLHTKKFYISFRVILFLLGKIPFIDHSVAHGACLCWAHGIRPINYCHSIIMHSDDSHSVHSITLLLCWETTHIIYVRRTRCVNLCQIHIQNLNRVINKQNKPSPWLRFLTLQIFWL